MGHSLSRIVVTGGAGFIGSHLVPKLLSGGYKVLVIDNLYSGRREYVPPQADFVELDLARTDEPRVFDVFRDYCPDAIIHLAGIHYIPHCIANPAETLLVNVRSTDVIARGLRELPTQKLIAASTGDVYPSFDRAHPETERPAPSNPYSVSKLLLEEIIASAARTNPHLSCTALRLFNVYGPRDTNPHVIPRIIELLRNPVSEIRLGTMNTTRDFIHVDDVVRAICLALERNGDKYDVFNVGTGRATSIRDVLKILLHAVGGTRRVVQDETLLRDYDRPSLTSDITKICRVLDWEPVVALEEGLNRLVMQAVLIPS